MTSIHLCLCKTNYQLCFFFIYNSPNSTFFFHSEQQMALSFRRPTTVENYSTLFLSSISVANTHTLTNRHREKEKNIFCLIVTVNVTIYVITSWHGDRSWCCYHLNMSWLNTKYDNFQMWFMTIDMFMSFKKIREKKCSVEKIKRFNLLTLPLHNRSFVCSKC